MITSALVLPMAPALLAPRSAVDPVADLRAACADAVGSALADGTGRVVVVAPPVDEANRRRGITEPLGHRVARQLLGPHECELRLAGPDAAAGLLESTAPTTLLVMADGSARRGEKAPGHLHPAAIGFDDVIEKALRTGDGETLAALDPDLGEELWCQGVASLRVLGEVARGRVVKAAVSLADAPYGVAWWVARWDLA